MFIDRNDLVGNLTAAAGYFHPMHLAVLGIGKQPTPDLPEAVTFKNKLYPALIAYPFAPFVLRQSIGQLVRTEACTAADGRDGLVNSVGRPAVLVEGFCLAEQKVRKA